jgi:hypothetical protein
MIGILVLLIAIPWLLFANYIGIILVTKSKGNIFKICISIFLSFLIVIAPFTDEIIGRVQFEHLCSTEAKAWVSSNAKEITSARRGIERLEPREGLIFPVTEQEFTYIDTKTGATFYSVKAFHTPGGWIMRHGLNLGNSSSCWPERWMSRDLGLDIDSILERNALK